MTFRSARCFQRRVGAWLVLAVAGSLVCAPGAVRTWTGAVNSDWFDPANWQDGAAQPGIPQAGDTVLVNTDSVLLTNATPELAAFTLSGATVTFSNWVTALRAMVVTVDDGGILTLPPAFTNAPAMSNRVHVVCTDFTLMPGGRIDARGRGYRGGALTVNGYGPGRGTVSGSGYYGGGGSHGGRGGGGSQGSSGPIYGLTNAPVTPGSGGGGNGAGHGGGAVRIDAAGAVLIDGVIDAAGNHASTHGGGGSGGSIYITCRTFGGTTNGLLTAAGGRSSYDSNGGGGGRIAVVYDTVAQAAMPEPKVRMNVARGPSPDSVNYLWSQIGTLYFPDARLLTADLDHFTAIRLFGVTAWTVSDLALTDGRITFAEPEFTLTVSNRLTVGAGAVLSLGSVLDPVEFQALYCKSIVVTNGGVLQVSAGPTNGIAPDHGAIVWVTNSLILASNSWIYPVTDPDNGGAPLFRVGSLAIDAAAGFDGAGRGYGRGVMSRGKGPGGGAAGGTAYYGGGGGHGGAGGPGNQGAGGGVYGSSNAPITAGSGGGGNTRGDGGGVVRLEVAGAAVVNGMISVNGGAGALHGGGGAGGSIFIAAHTFRGAETAVMRANGGRGGGASNDGGGGGGGRISIGIGISESDRNRLLAGEDPAGLLVYDTYAAYFGTLSVSNGLGAAGGHGQPGTRQFFQVQQPGTVTLTVQGHPGTYGEPSPYYFGPNINIPSGTWLVNTVASPVGQVNGLRRALSGWSVTNAAGDVRAYGSHTKASFRIAEHLWQTWYWTNEWRLTTASADPAKGSVNSAFVDGWYIEGQTVADITATASNGFQFQRWMGDGVPHGQAHDNPLTVTMDRARTLTAHFTAREGVVRTWNGATGSWFEPANWTPADVPQGDDHVIIGHGTVWLTDWSEIGRLTVSNGATLVFSNWPTFLGVADGVTLGGTVALPAAFDHSAGGSNRIELICGWFDLLPGGLVNVKGRGYRGGAHGVAGYGPGAGTTTAFYGGGGSHGGRGGSGSEGHSGPVYGRADAPASPGSGGGGTSAGSGGGVVRITASGSVRVDGVIDADGSNSTSHGGGGSGGSIHIVCQTFAGSAGGMLTASGGSSAYASAGGGGGRIAIQYDPAAQTPMPKSPVRLSAARGGAPTHSAWRQPQPGTVHLPDALTLPARVDHLLDARLLGVRSWNTDTLTVVSSRVAMAEADFALSVADTLTIGTNAWFAVGSALDPREFLVVNAGELHVRNGGVFEIRSAPTNGIGLDHGARVAVAGSIRVESNAWIHPVADPVNGGAPWVLAGQLVVAAGGGFDAAGRGYQRGTLGKGFGPGGGNAGGSAYYGGGGGHGGRGGHASQGTGGPPYGSATVPVTAGSGGGGNTIGDGGGVIRIRVAETAQLDGLLTANGRDAALHGGGGAGGTILLEARTVAGGPGGRLSADGGRGGPAGTGGGGGGGGRIAVWMAVPEPRRRLFLDGFDGGILVGTNMPPAFQGAVSVEYGSGVNDPPHPDAAQPGTVMFVYRRGSLLQVR